MTRIQLLAALCCVFSSTFLAAQVTIKGTITDQIDGSVLPFASVALLKQADSSLITGTVTKENGTFVIPNIGAGQYLIMAAFIGYPSVYSDAFTLTGSSTTATVDIKMDNTGKLLKEAVITAKRPLFEQKADRLVVNVADSPIAAGGTAMEILTKVPGVAIIQDRVTLGGSQSVQIWIDGKPSQYTDMNLALRNMPGDQIDRIELIAQPGARYDAAGGPVLNIILKRNANLGFTCTASLTLGGYRYSFNDIGFSERDFYRLNPSLSVNYRKNKWNLFGNTSYNQGDYFTLITTDRFINNETYTGRNFEISKYDYKNLRAGADYYLSQKTTLGVTARGWQRKGSGDANSLTRVIDNATTSEKGTFITDNISDNYREGYSTSVNVTHHFDTTKTRTLSFDADYNRFNTRSTNNLAIYPDLVSSFVSLSQQVVKQPVNIYVAKMDYTHPLDSTTTLETGIKTSIATINNDLAFFRSAVLSANESNDFLYKENINAAYASIRKKLKKWELNAGIRAEQTRARGATDYQRVLDRNYLQWFPSASTMYKLNKQMGIQASYSRRVNRPGFDQQNPFSYFIDSLTYTRGNPKLLPETQNVGQLNFVYEGQPVAGVSITRTSDVIIDNAPQLEGTRTFTTSENLAQYTNVSFQLNFPIKLGKYIDGFGGNQAILNAYNANYRGVKYDVAKWHWLAYWGVSGNLPGGIKAEVDGYYLTQFLNEFLVIGNMGAVNIGVSKTFWDSRGRIAINWNDILYSERTRATIDLADVAVNFGQRDYSRNIRLSMSYKFGNTKLKSARNRDGASKEETSRVKVE
jgi:Outer membrane protein beta-barrel family/Carboxypeptidase regulatory-like domain